VELWGFCHVWICRVNLFFLIKPDLLSHSLFFNILCFLPHNRPWDVMESNPYVAAKTYFNGSAYWAWFTFAWAKITNVCRYRHQNYTYSYMSNKVSSKCPQPKTHNPFQRNLPWLKRRIMGQESAFCVVSITLFSLRSAASKTAKTPGALRKFQRKKKCLNNLRWYNIHRKLQSITGKKCRSMLKKQLMSLTDAI